MKGMQMRPFVCVIKGMYEFAFSVCTIKVNVTELGAQKWADMALQGLNLPSIFVQVLSISM